MSCPSTAVLQNRVAIITSEHGPFAAVLYQIDGFGETPWRQAAESSQKLGVVVKGRIDFENRTGLFPLETGQMILINTYAPFRWVNREKEPAEVLSVEMRPLELYEEVDAKRVGVSFLRNNATARRQGLGE